MGGVSRFLGIVFLNSKRLGLVCLGHARRDSFANYRPRKKKGACPLFRFCSLVLSLFHTCSFSLFRVMRRANVELYESLTKERKESNRAKKYVLLTLTFNT